jgi:hypothetical protein
LINHNQLSATCISFSCFQKHQDAFASAFGFFLLGFDWISKFHSPQNIQPKFFGVTDPVIAFFNVSMHVYKCLFKKIVCMFIENFYSSSLPSPAMQPPLLGVAW